MAHPPRPPPGSSWSSRGRRGSSLGRRTSGASMRSVGGVQHVWRRLEWRDWALPAALLVVTQLDVWLGWQRVAAGPPAAFSLIGMLTCLALVDRRRHPLAVLGVGRRHHAHPSALRLVRGDAVAGADPRGRDLRGRPLRGATVGLPGCPLQRRRPVAGDRAQPVRGGGLLVGVVTERGLDLRAGSRIPARAPAPGTRRRRRQRPGPSGGGRSTAARRPGPARRPLAQPRRDRGAGRGRRHLPRRRPGPRPPCHHTS